MSMATLAPVRAPGRYAYTAFRAVAGFLFACHGAATVLGVLGGAAGAHGHAAPLGQWPGWWAGLIQLCAGTAVAAGLATRPAALLASGSMAYAYFTVHQPHALLPIQNGGEPAAVFCWAFLLIAATGPGPHSADRLLSRPRTRPAPAPAPAQPART